MNRKRGSLIVESALVLPIVILTIFVLLSLTFHFYDEICAQTDHFSKLRNAAKVEGKTTYNEAKFAGDIDFLLDGMPKKRMVSDEKQ